MAEVKGVDKVLPDSKKLKVGEHEVEIGVFTTREALSFLKFSDEQGKGNWSNEETLLRSVELMASILSKRNEKITAEYLLDNTSVTELRELTNAIMGSATGESGNEEAAQ